MAERIDIVVSVNGTLTVKRELDSIGASGSKAGQGITALQSALALLGGAQVARGLANVVDSFINIQNRLKLVTTSTQVLTAVTEELLDVSNRTRSSFEANAELFNRLSLSARQLGITEAEALQITESLNQAIIISGATTKEANNALIQFTQGLAQGSLQGQELKSILQQLPAVADVIAKQLGVARGALKDLASEGAITPAVIVEGFKNAREELQEKFGKTTATLGQVFVVLQNVLVTFFGNLAKGAGVTDLFAKAVKFLGENAELVGRVALAGVFTTAVLGAVVAVNLLSAAITASPIGTLVVLLTAAASALAAFSDKIKLTEDGLTSLEDVGRATFSSIGQFATDTTAEVGKFFDSFKEGGDKIKSVGPAIEFTLENALRAIAAVGDVFVGFFVGIKDAIVLAFKQGVNEIANLLDTGRKAFNDIVGPVVGFIKTVGDTFSIVFNGIAVAAQGLGTAVNQALHGNFEEAQRFASEAVNTIATSTDVAISTFGERFAKSFDFDTNEFVPPFKDAGGTAADAFIEGFSSTPVTDILNGILETANKEAIKNNKAALEAAGQQAVDLSKELVPGGEDALATGPSPKFLEELSKLREKGELLRFNNEQRGIEAEFLRILNSLEKEHIELTADEKEILKNRIALNQSLADQAAVLDSINGPLEDYERQLTAVNALQAQAAITAEQAADAIREFKIQALESQEDFTSGFERGLLKIEDEFANLADNAEGLITDAFKGIEDVFVNFALTGEVSFRQLIDSILADLARLASEQLLGQLLASFGGAGGVAAGFAGLFGGTNSLGPGGTGASGLAAGLGGGGGENALLGSVGPSFNLAGVGGTATGFAAGLSAPQPQVNLQVVNVQDQNTVPTAMNSPEGQRVILNVIRQNRRRVSQDLR